MSPSESERVKSRERLLGTIFPDSGHLQHQRERPDMKRQPELTTLNQWRGRSQEFCSGGASH